MTCDDVRASLHEAHDENPAAAASEAVRSHVAGCSACREFEGDLQALTRALRTLPRSPLPADALELVWKKTSRSRPAPSWLTAGWMRLAAAVVVSGVSIATLYYVYAPPPVDPAARELAKASAQAELVLGYTARALAATRHATADRVLASRVSPAVRGHVTPDPRRP